MLLNNNIRMLRTCLRLTPTFIFPILNQRNENDEDKIHKLKVPVTESGIDRVKQMFTTDEYGATSVELNSVIQSSFCGAIFGAILGGFVKSKDAYVYFIENNQATIFKTTGEAKKKLQDYVTIAFAKGAYHWGWRLGFFTGTFTLLTTVIQVYYGDTSLMDYITAGAITGAVYKANLGLPGAIVGAGLGAVLSAVGGLAIMSILKVAGVTMGDIRNAMFNIKEAREEQFHQAKEKAAVIKNDDLTRHHDHLVSTKGEQKIQDLP